MSSCYYYIFRLKTHIGDQSGISLSVSHYVHEIQHIGPALKHNLQQSNHKKENLRFLYTRFKVKAPVEQPLLMSITEGIFESTISTCTSTMVLCQAPLLKWSLCSLWSTEKAKWSIYKSSKGKSEAESEYERGEQNALDSLSSVEWDKYKHFLHQCHFIESSARPGGC